jgi:starvation-inducible DNA-binding protein
VARTSNAAASTRSSASTGATRGSASTKSAAGSRPVTSTHRAAFTAPGLDPEAGQQVADELQSRLVALIDLGLTLKHIHWNVVGPSFIGVHMMLDPQYAGVSAMIDAVAERIATLGGVPNGLPGALVAARAWDDYELGRADTQAHLAALDLVYGGVIADHRAAIEVVDELDPVSGDLLITQTGVLEEYHWFVRGHLEDYAGGLSTAGTRTELDAATAAVRRKAARADDGAPSNVGPDGVTAGTRKRRAG